MKKKVIFAAVVAIVFISDAQSQVIIYSTDFSDPPFQPGVDTWAGTDGWEANESSVQGIFNYSGTQAGFLGFNAPANTNGIGYIDRLLNYDPVGAGTPVVNFSMDVAIEDSSNGQYDNFFVDIYNADFDLLGSINFDNTPLEMWRYDGASYFNTGATFENNTLYTLQFSINFGSNIWSANLGSISLFSGVTFNGDGANLNLGGIAFSWVLSDQSAPGDNFMVVDNIQVTGVPEPSTYALLALTAAGALWWARRRRWLAGRLS